MSFSFLKISFKFKYSYSNRRYRSLVYSNSIKGFSNFKSYNNKKPFKFRWAVNLRPLETKGFFIKKNTSSRFFEVPLNPSTELVKFFINQSSTMVLKRNHVFMSKPGLKLTWRSYRNEFREEWKIKYIRQYNICKLTTYLFKIKSVNLVCYYFFNLYNIIKSTFFFF